MNYSISYDISYDILLGH